MTNSITRQQRVVVLLTLVALALVLLFVSSVSAADPGDVDAEWTATHLVVGGDTLWEIALDATAPGDDVRTVVEDIKRYNGLSSSLIFPGQVLFVPSG